jgi:hypothetical protein
MFNVSFFNQLDVFFNSAHFKKLNPLPHAYESLLKLKLDFELHIVTSRQLKVEEDTVKWINQHFPDIFTAIHLGNHYVKEGKSRSKSEICHSIGARLLIDDSVKYALQCVRDRIPVILFGNYAWNQVDGDAAALHSDVRFEEYSDSLVIDESNGVLACAAGGDEVGGEKKGATKQHVVYRVSNWREVLHLVYATFKIDSQF